MYFIILLLAVVIQVRGQSSPSFTNEISDAGLHVDCKQSSIKLQFATVNPFGGRVFVRGRYSDADCLRDFAANNDLQGMFEVPFGRCGVHRQRHIDPRGMSMNTVVVVSFHRHFITHLDKAFNVECFYAENTTVVHNELQVSQQPAMDIAHRPPMPKCRYEVLSGDRDGQPISFAQVGDTVYHKWSCTTPMQGMYCMLIHSCTVADDTDEVYVLIDESGCSKDRSLLDNIDYEEDLIAGIPSLVFKFADRPGIHFTCQIRLSIKDDHNGNVCPKPDCNLRGRRKKRAGSGSGGDLGMGEDFDLVANSLTVLDLDDPPQIAYNDPNRPNFANTIGSRTYGRTRGSGQTICLSSFTLATIVAACLILFVSAVIISVLYFYKPYYIRKHTTAF